MAGPSVKLSLESLQEHKVQEISLDGLETYTKYDILNSITLFIFVLMYEFDSRPLDHICIDLYKWISLVPYIAFWVSYFGIILGIHLNYLNLKDVVYELQY